MGTYATTSSASLGQTNTLTPSYSYGPYSQTTAGGCTSCYYGETAAPIRGRRFRQRGTCPAS